MLNIRMADARDMRVIVDFIRKLAAYEELSDALRFDAAVLEGHLFGERPAAEVLIAEWDGAPAGFALFYSTFSTFAGAIGLYLEDLFVEPELRGKGIGRALLARLAALVVERDGVRLDWSVLDWNAPAQRFYRALGAGPVESWEYWRVEGDALHRLARDRDGVPE